MGTRRDQQLDRRSAHRRRHRRRGRRPRRRGRRPRRRGLAGQRRGVRRGVSVADVFRRVVGADPSHRTPRRPAPSRARRRAVGARRLGDRRLAAESDEHRHRGHLLRRRRGQTPLRWRARLARGRRAAAPRRPRQPAQAPARRCVVADRAGCRGPSDDLPGRGVAHVGRRARCPAGVARAPLGVHLGRPRLVFPPRNSRPDGRPVPVPAGRGRLRVDVARGAPVGMAAYRSGATGPAGTRDPDADGCRRFEPKRRCSPCPADGPAPLPRRLRRCRGRCRPPCCARHRSGGTDRHRPSVWLARARRGRVPDRHQVVDGCGAGVR